MVESTEASGRLTCAESARLAAPMAVFDERAAFLADSNFNEAELVAAFREHRSRLPRPRLTLLVRYGALNREAADTVLESGYGYQAFPPVKLTPPINWAADPFEDRTWRYNLNTLSFLDPVLSTYELEGDARCLEYATKVCRDWIVQHVDGGAEHPFAWYDMAVGLRATKLAWLVDAAARAPASVDDETLLVLLCGAQRHAEELADPEKLKRGHNHGIYQLLGLLELVRTLPELSEAEARRRYAEAELEQLFLESFCEPEGMHLEQSPSYHVSLANRLHTVLEQGYLNSPRLKELRDRAFGVLAWMTHPQGHLARFGDGPHNLAQVSVSVVPESLRASCPHTVYALTKGREGEPPKEGGLVLPKSGYAFVRGHWPTADKWAAGSYLALSAAFHSTAHKHADDGTFEWSDRGHSIVVDPGTFGYHYKDPGRIYCESTRAHNVLVVDGRDYSRDPQQAFGSAIKRWATRGRIWAIETRFTRPGQVAHRRTFIHRPGAWLLVIDECDARGDHRYEQWFHFDPSLELHFEGNRAQIEVPSSRNVIHVLNATTANEVEFNVVRGQEEPELQGWCSRAYRELEPSYAISYEAVARSLHMATLFVWGGPSDKPASSVLHLSGDTIHCEWSLGAEVGRVSLSRDDHGLQIENTPE